MSLSNHSPNLSNYSNSVTNLVTKSIMRPVRERSDNPIIDANGKVQISNWEQFPSLRTDLPACRQCYQLESHLILISREGQLIANCEIELKLAEMRIIELIPIHHYTNEILIMNEVRTVYWCRIVDDELIIIAKIDELVRQAVVVGNDINEGLMVLVVFTDASFKMIITNPITGLKYTILIEIDGGIKWMEGESHGKMTTIVSNNNELRLLDWKGEFFDPENDILNVNESDKFSDFLDAIRMEDYWVIIRRDRIASILILKSDSERIRTRIAASPLPHIRARKDNLKIATSLSLPINNHLFSFDIGVNFVRFLNEDYILDNKGLRYLYQVNYLTGVMTLTCA